MDIGVIILAIIQGIAEFLPISSSAHLIIFRDIFGIGAETITGDIEIIFDVALHFGTLLAIAIFFFKDFWNMVISGVTKGTKTSDGKLFWFVVVATIPAAVAGFLFEDMIVDLIRNNLLIIGSSLVFMGIVMYFADTRCGEDNNLKKMSFIDALVIGISQVFALIPGFSRSGTTIASARYLKLNREDAAKFSFYLSAPIVFGAVLLHLLDSSDLALITANINIFIPGVLISFVTGLLCIKFLLQYIKKHDFKIFMIYRVLIGVFVIIYFFIK